MLKLAGYGVTQALYQGSRMEVYQGIRLLDGLPVIMKTVAPSSCLKRHMARLKYEYDLLSSLVVEKVTKALSFEHSEVQPTLILEDIGSQSLDKSLDSSPMCLDQFFHLALQLVDTLGQVHQKGIIHKDLTSNNILWNSKSGNIHLIDFDFSVQNIAEQRFRHSSYLDGIDLSHMSPEQTGRINRDLDFRADFYSLGVTFYQWLTGQLPFLSADPMEMIYFHIAKLPMAPNERVSSIPHAVSSIVLKLLAKTPEERYQSCHGLYQDLNRCYGQFKKPSEVFDFHCGANDVPFQLRMPQKLYGRTEELPQLQAEFEKVQGGAVEMSLISGPSGIGKSALAREFHRKYVSQARGYFCQGKFDSSFKQFPYFGLVQALRDLAKQLLTETPESLERWKAKLLKALGANGRVMTEIIPELEWIIGEQPPIADMGPRETKNRFNLTFQYLMQALAQKEHPLILFIDDMQWSDTATIEFCEQLMDTSSLGHLYIICAYRDNEVPSSHPFALMLQEIEKSKILSHIKLASLTLECVNALISDVLFCEQKILLPLAKLIREKTQGSPFFVIEFLKILHEHACLWYQMDEGKWRWDLEGIENLGITDNVTDIIKESLEKCSSSCRQALHFASCLGTQFDLKTLAIITEKKPSQLSYNFLEAHRHGVVSVIGEDSTFWNHSPDDFDEMIEEETLAVIYRFQHDQIRQATYEAIPDHERQVAHLRIGKQLLSRIDEKKKQEKIFEALSQFNPYHEAIVDAEERQKLAELNREAAELAKSSTAYQQAHHYISHALKFFDESKWETDYHRAFSIWFSAAECDFLCNKFEDAEEKTKFLLEKGQSIHDKVHIQNLKVNCYTSSGNFNRAIEEGLEGLQYMAVPISINPSQGSLVKEMLKLKLSMLNRQIEEVADAPIMEDSDKTLMVNCLSSLIAPAYSIGNQSLFALLSLKICNISLKHGNHPFSAYAFVAYGVIQCSLGNYEKGYRLGAMGVSLAERFQNPFILSSVYYAFGVLISSWKRPRSESIRFLKKAHQPSLDSGNFFFGGYSALFVYNYYSNLDLPTILTESEKYFPFIESIRDPILNKMYFALRQYRLTWTGEVPTPPSWNSEEFDEAEYFSYLKSKNYITAVTWFSAVKIEQLYCFEEYEAALKLSEENETILLETNLAYEYTTTPFFFFTFLSLVALYPGMGTQKPKALKKIKALQKSIAKWRKNCPDNFETIYWITVAELSALSGKHARAKDAFDKAITAGEQTDFAQRFALANELAAKYYEKQGQPKLAKFYMKEAVKAYEQWGAKGKIVQLQKAYSELLDGPDVEQGGGRGLEDLPVDFLSIIKVSQAISKETQSDQLLKKLIQILLENTGARKAYFLSGKEGQISVHAWGEMQEQTEIELKSLPYEEEDLPQTLIRYVLRTQETIVLQDAKDDSRFSHDPYVVEHSPKSVLCSAIPLMGNAICILYLENNLVVDAFSQEQMEILKVISSQVAISLENTQLYGHLQDKTEELTSTLSELRELHVKQTDLLEQERQRIAQELHDEAQQIFGAVERTYAKRLPEPMQETFHQEMGAGQTAIDSAINDLYPPVLRNLGLFSAIEEYTIRLNETKNMDIEFKCQADVDLPQDVHLSLFRIVQESLSNIYKHARTPEAEVILQVLNNKTLWIQISDDGKGFDAEKPSNRFGLKFMQERARQVGATVSIQSEVNEGTTVICKLPLD